MARIPPPPSDGLGKFFKENTAGPLNKLFLLEYVRTIATAENKTKALFRVLREMALLRFTWTAALATSFLGVQKILGAILRDTGSLEAALRRMQSIQGFQRSLAPFLGGLAVAKQRVAELIALSSKGPFRFEDVAGGQRSLLSSTRGAFAGNKALETVGNAAAASGNGFEETAGAVGNFYEALRSGAPIREAAEQLRQMGLLTQTTADDLGNLQKSGASNAEVFDRLAQSLAGSSGAMESMKEDLASVTAAHEKAGEELKVAFGQSFTADEIQNTKNYTAAMTALAPVAGRLGSFFEVFTGGLSTMKSGLAKSAAESKIFQAILEGIPKVLAIGAAALSAWAASSLALQAGAIAAGGAFTGLLAPLNKLLTAVPALSGAVRVLAGSLAVLSVIGVIAIAATVVVGYIHSINQAAEKVREMAKSHLEAEAAIRKQIAAMKSLADAHEVVEKAMAAEQDALAALSKAREEAGAKYDKYNYGNPLLLFKSTEAKARRRENAINEDETVRSKEADLGKARANALRALQKGPEGLTSEAQQELARKNAQQALQAEEDEYQRRLSAGTGNRAELIGGRASVLAGREGEAEAGRRAVVQDEQRKFELQRKLNQAQEKGDVERVKKLQGELERSGLLAPAASSTYLRTRAQLLREGKLDEGARPRALQLAEAARLDVRAETAAAREADTSRPSRQLASEAAQAEREQRINALQEQLDLRGKAARRAGRSEEAVNLGDARGFVQQYSGLRQQGLGVDEAARRARALANEDIFGSARATGTVVASSLARIGGGGGVYTAGNDNPQLQVARRQEKLQSDIYKLVEKIEKKGTGVL